jgi:hypothetical protein
MKREMSEWADIPANHGSADRSAQSKHISSNYGVKNDENVVGSRDLVIKSINTRCLCLKVARVGHRIKYTAAEECPGFYPY